MFIMIAILPSLNRPKEFEGLNIPLGPFRYIFANKKKFINCNK